MSTQLWGHGESYIAITMYFPWEMWKRNRHRIARKYRERKRVEFLKARIRKYTRKPI